MAAAVKLTKRIIEGTAPSSARQILWDTELRGFGIRIEPTGTRTFIVRFRPKGTGRAGPKRFVVLGRFGALTLDQARTMAKAVLGRVAQGEDPTNARDDAKGAPTLASLSDRFLTEHILPKKKASTAALYGHYLRKLILPILGSKKVGEITHCDILKLHGAIGRTRPVTANRVVSTLSSLFSYGAKIGEVPKGVNPAAGVEGYREKGRQRFLSSAELARLGEALREAETTGLSWDFDETRPKAKHLAKAENRRRIIDPFAVAAIRVLILTGGRLREVLHARWDFFDAERGMLNLPDSKTDEKSIYLSAAALSVLSALPRIAGNPFIFLGEGKKRIGDADRVVAPRADLKKPWAAICNAAGLPGLRLHDLRHTFASYGAGAQLGLPIIGKLLGHSQPGTTARYAHLDADPMHRAADAIGSTIDAAMNRKIAEVVPLKRGSG